MNFTLERPLSDFYSADVRAEIARLRRIDFDIILACHRSEFSRQHAQRKPSRKIQE